MESAARDISPKVNGLSKQVSKSMSLSTSPSATLHSSPSSYNAPFLTRTTTSSLAKQLKPFATQDIKILLLENINQTGLNTLAKQGYQVEIVKSSLPEDELIQRIR